jgi:hypothetical protein
MTKIQLYPADHQLAVDRELIRKSRESIAKVRIPMMPPGYSKPNPRTVPI